MTAEWQVRSIFHFTVEATDFERSLDFYTTIGFQVLRDNRDVVWPRMVARNFGMPAAQGRGALLAIGDGELHTRLDLIQWLDPTPAPPPRALLRWEPDQGRIHHPSRFGAGGFSESAGRTERGVVL